MWTFVDTLEEIHPASETYEQDTRKMLKKLTKFVYSRFMSASRKRYYHRIIQALLCGDIKKIHHICQQYRKIESDPTLGSSFSWQSLICDRERVKRLRAVKSNQRRRGIG